MKTKAGTLPTFGGQKTNGETKNEMKDIFLQHLQP
jgi:hypothetical protein